MNENSISQSEEIVKEISDLIEAQNTKDFNKRKKGLFLKTFLISFTLTICLMKRVTLEGLALKCQDLQPGLRLSKQALHKRLKQGSIEMKALLENVIARTIPNGTLSPRSTIVLYGEKYSFSLFIVAVFWYNISMQTSPYGFFVW